MLIFGVTCDVRCGAGRCCGLEGFALFLAMSTKNDSWETVRGLYRSALSILISSMVDPVGKRLPIDATCTLTRLPPPK